MNVLELTLTSVDEEDGGVGQSAAWPGLSMDRLTPPPASEPQNTAHIQETTYDVNFSKMHLFF